MGAAESAPWGPGGVRGSGSDVCCSAAVLRQRRLTLLVRSAAAMLRAVTARASECSDWGVLTSANGQSTP